MFLQSGKYELVYDGKRIWINEKKTDSSGEKLTAVFAISDSLAIGACKAVFDAGKSVPEDYSIAGFDGLDMAHYYNPAITTIHQPVEEMAYETLRILFDQDPQQSFGEEKPAENFSGKAGRGAVNEGTQIISILERVNSRTWIRSFFYKNRLTNGKTMCITVLRH